MAFDSVSDFLAMGGYAFYVWMAYGIATLLVAGYFLALRRQRHTNRRRIQRMLAREAQQQEIAS